MSRYIYDKTRVAAAKDELQKAIEEVESIREDPEIKDNISFLQQYFDIESNYACYYVDQVSTAIADIKKRIVTMEEAIEEYNSGTDLQHFLSTFGMGTFKIIEGGFTFIEDLLKGGATVLYGFDYFNIFIDNDTMESFLKKDYVGDFFSEQYETGFLKDINKYSDFSHESTYANLLKGFGNALPYVALSLTGVGLAAEAKLAFLTGLGGGTSRALRAGAGKYTAIRTGVEQGAFEAIATVAMDKAFSKIGSWIKERRAATTGAKNANNGLLNKIFKKGAKEGTDDIATQTAKREVELGKTKIIDDELAKLKKADMDEFTKAAQNRGLTGTELEKDVSDAMKKKWTTEFTNESTKTIEKKIISNQTEEQLAQAGREAAGIKKLEQDAAHDITKGDMRSTARQRVIDKELTPEEVEAISKQAAQDVEAAEKAAKQAGKTSTESLEETTKKLTYEEIGKKKLGSDVAGKSKQDLIKEGQKVVEDKTDDIVKDMQKQINKAEDNALENAGKSEFGKEIDKQNAKKLEELETELRKNGKSEKKITKELEKKTKELEDAKTASLDKLTSEKCIEKGREVARKIGHEEIETSVKAAASPKGTIAPANSLANAYTETATAAGIGRRTAAGTVVMTTKKTMDAEVSTTLRQQSKQQEKLDTLVTSPGDAEIEIKNKINQTPEDVTTSTTNSTGEGSTGGGYYYGGSSSGTTTIPSQSELPTPSETPSTPDTSTETPATPSTPSETPTTPSTPSTPSTNPDTVTRSDTGNTWNNGSSGIDHGGNSSSSDIWSTVTGGTENNSDLDIDDIDNPDDDLIDDDIFDNDYDDNEEEVYTIPTNLSQSTSTKTSTKNNSAIPILGGLGAAAAVGVGAKIYMDNQKNNDNGEDIEEWDENSYDENNLLADDWAGNSTDDTTNDEKFDFNAAVADTDDNLGEI